MVNVSPITPSWIKVLQHIRKDPASGCWIWTDRYMHQGYGFVHVFEDGRWVSRRAHRVAYQAFVGPIPADLQLDHTCHNTDETCKGGDTCPHRACVNPAHLEPVTNKINSGRGRGGQHHAERWSERDTCDRGHRYTEENTRRDAAGGRHCRACSRSKTRRWDGLGVRGPRVRIVARQGRTLQLACGHAKTLKHYPDASQVTACCLTCETEIAGGTRDHTAI